MQMRRNILLAVLAIALMLPQVSMAKETGHQSYTYNVYGESVPGPAPYEIVACLDAASLGLDKAFNGLSDVFYEKDGGCSLLIQATIESWRLTQTCGLSGNIRAWRRMACCLPSTSPRRQYLLKMERSTYAIPIMRGWYTWTATASGLQNMACRIPR